MTDDRVDFASMLASRLCHDLLSPVGAFANGLELLADEKDPDMRARCFDLLEQSARTSAAKLKFFRLAFGSAGGFGEAVPPAEARAAIEGIMAERPITLNWMIGDEPLPKPAVKIILNLALILVDALVRGGRLDVGVEGGEVVVRAEGARIVLDAEIREVLASGRGPVTSRTSAVWLTRRLADDEGGSITLADQEEGVLLLGAHLPG